MRQRLGVLMALLAGILILAGPVTQAASAPATAADFAIANGHFFTEGNGQGGAGGSGFAITDDGAAAFWSAFQRLGGVDALGYPVSNRVVWQGFLVQATQRQVLQWHPELGQALPVNGYDVLHDMGKDAWLAAARDIPPPASTAADSGLSWAQVAARHLAYLDADPASKARYLHGSGDPLLMNGLPMSPVTREGAFAVIRCQRTTIRHRLVDDPVAGAHAGTIEVLYGSEDVRISGLLPDAAVQPLAAPAGPAPAFPQSAMPFGTATRVATPSATPRQALVAMAATSTRTATRTATATPSATATSTPLAVPATPTAAATARPATEAPAASKAAAAPAGAARPAGPGGFTFGFQAHMYYGQAAPALAAIDRAGFGWVKQQVEWRAIQPNGPGDQGWGDLDTIVAAARAGHTRVLLSVVQAPAWAAVAADKPYPKNPADAAAFVGKLASRYQGQIGAIEIWNEENFAREVGSGNIDAGRYVELLKACFAAIRAADASILVVSGAPTPTGVNDPTIAIDDSAYLQQMYAYQGGIVRNYFDILGAHAEAWANPPESTVGSPEPANVTGFNNHPSFFFRRLEDYRQTMVAAGDSKKQVWETEFGYDSCPDPAPAPRGYEYCKLVTEQQQADYLVRAFQYAQAHYPWLGGIFIWNLNFQHFAPASDEKWGFGLLRADYSPRPAYLALQQLVKGKAGVGPPIAASLAAAVHGKAARPITSLPAVRAAAAGRLMAGASAQAALHATAIPPKAKVKPTRPQ